MGRELGGGVGQGREDKDMRRREEGSGSILNGTFFYFKERSIIAYQVY